jgi:hypothetical protein
MLGLFGRRVFDLGFFLNGYMWWEGEGWAGFMCWSFFAVLPCLMTDGKRHTSSWFYNGDEEMVMPFNTHAHTHTHIQMSALVFAMVSLFVFFSGGSLCSGGRAIQKRGKES